MSNLSKSPIKKIVIFASGSGTNAENIIKYFEKHEHIQVVAVLSNKRTAGALRKAYDLGVKSLLFDKKALYHSHEILNLLKDINPDLIVLAGFLWLMPPHILEEFPDKFINIHPALLPKYGGKGMYGHRVHEAVIENKETQSGITIHYVNPKYDEGRVIFQESVDIESNDSPERLAEKIHELEYRYFPEVIQNLLEDK